MTKSFAVYNPDERAAEDLPIIFGFNNGECSGHLLAQLIAEDGTALGSHICSDEFWMLSDLGILEHTAPDRHKIFREHYPKGYRMTFVPFDAIGNHNSLLSAMELNEKMK